MPYSAAHKASTRKAIVRAAARAFRAHGISGVSIPEVMREVGLTHGGFYAHFPTKDALAASAFGEGFDESAQRLLDESASEGGQSQAERGRAFVRAYLSRAHRDMPDLGCVLPSLSAEVARSSAEVRAGYTATLRGYAHKLATLLPLRPGESEDERDERALLLLAGMAGALEVARAVDDPALSDRLLLRARALYMDAFDGEAGRAESSE